MFIFSNEENGAKYMGFFFLQNDFINEKFSIKCCKSFNSAPGYS